MVTTTVEGRERFGVTVRYPRELRANPEQIEREVLVPVMGGAMVPLGQVAKVVVARGAPGIRTENALLSAYIYVDIRDRDIGSYVADAKKAVAAKQERHAAASVRNADKPGARRRPGRGVIPGAAPERGQKAARGLGGDQVEGRHAVRELLLAGTRRVREIYVAEEQEDTEVLQDIVDLAIDLKVPVREVTRTRLLSFARTESPQGVLARAAELPEYELNDLAHARTASGAPPFLLAVDGVTDPGNLGALLRSAECAGVSGIVLPKHRAVHITPTVTKAAAGAVEYLPMSLVGGLPNAINELKAAYAHMGSRGVMGKLVMVNE
jgi:tRNA G18 (ribose-2'-O)-methylase SpoU